MGVIPRALADPGCLRGGATFRGLARMAGARLPASRSRPARRSRRRRRRGLAGHRGGLASTPRGRRVHGEGAAGPRIRSFDDATSGCQRRPDHGQSSAGQGAARGPSGVHRRAARRGKTSGHGPARLHVLALRRRGAALQGATVVSTMPARRDMCLTRPARRATSQQAATFAPISRQHARAARCRPPRDAHRPPAREHRRVANSSRAGGRGTPRGRYRAGARHSRPRGIGCCG